MFLAWDVGVQATRRTFCSLTGGLTLLHVNAVIDHRRRRRREVSLAAFCPVCGQVARGRDDAVRVAKVWFHSECFRSDASRASA